MISFIVAFIVTLIPVQIKSNSSCNTVIHIGDSLTANGYNNYVNNYKMVGFSNVIVSAGGSRTFTSKRKTDVHTGLQAIEFWKKKYPSSACWVIDLGTNDSGYVSSQYAQKNINKAMSIIGKSKVIWVNVWKGKHSNSTKAKNWNATLSNALSKYSNVKLLKWTSYVKNNKSILGPDGVHYTGLGYQQRSKYITYFAKSYFIKSS